MSKTTHKPRPSRSLQEPALRQLVKELRAIGELMQDGESAREENQDLRIPFAKALHDLYGSRKSDAE